MRIKKIARWLSVSASIVIVLAWGFTLGFYVGTGELPQIVKPDRPETLPIPQAQSISTIESFLSNDTTNEIEYDQSYFNCLDYAWTLMRRMNLEGIESRIVKVSFEGDGYSHALVLVPTTDRGWILVEPQDDSEVDIKVGRFYLHNMGWIVVKSIEVLDYDWVDIEEFTGVEGAFK